MVKASSTGEDEVTRDTKPSSSPLLRPAPPRTHEYFPTNVESLQRIAAELIRCQYGSRAKTHLFTSEATTNGVRVKVRSRFSPEHSHPASGRWFFLYTIEIKNEGPSPVQLLSRHWVIEDADSKVQEVKGPGVVGEQPRLSPGESFEYTSGCPLTTPFGTMRGTYQMVRDDGSKFDAVVAPFTLSEPYTVH